MTIAWKWRTQTRVWQRKTQQTVVIMVYAQKRYLSVHLIRFLPFAVQQVPPSILDVADMDVITVVFTKGNPGATKNKQVVSMEDS